jgi:3-phenylpropionate/trans-cinnamate dioxygenase ferredoxin subunit
MLLEAVPLDQVPIGTSKLVRVADNDIALFNIDGTIYAIGDTCVHQGSSLSQGKLDGKVVTCRGHGWRFDVTTGYVANSPGFGVPAYRVKIVDGKIMVDIEKKV